MGPRGGTDWNSEEDKINLQQSWTFGFSYKKHFESPRGIYGGKFHFTLLLCSLKGSFVNQTLENSLFIPIDLQYYLKSLLASFLVDINLLVTIHTIALDPFISANAETVLSIKSGESEIGSIIWYKNNHLT